MIFISDIAICFEIGAKTANVKFANLESEYVLVGEPTESKFARASKGALTAFVHFDGIAA